MAESRAHTLTQPTAESTHIMSVNRSVSQLFSQSDDNWIILTGNLKFAVIMYQSDVLRFLMSSYSATNKITAYQAIILQMFNSQI